MSTKAETKPEQPARRKKPGVPESSKLPLRHPDFRYPDSRNPYAAKVKELRGRVFSGSETEEHRGHWREQMPDRAPPAGKRELHVEIGCNGGHVILEWAARNPKAAYVGIDWKMKQIYFGAEKALKRGISNLLFFRAHHDRIQYMFGPGEIDFLYLYFPDPWPRKSQWKNRFVTPENLREVAGLVRPGGVFHIKTDHAGYFEWMEEAIAQVRDLWDVRERTTNLHAGNPDATKLQIPEVTIFERVFVREGININSVKLVRK